MMEPTPPEVVHEVPAELAAAELPAWPQLPHLRLVGGAAQARRPQPENVEAEEAVVGAILFAGEKALAKVREVLRYPAPDPNLPPFSFFGEPREALFRTFLEMSEQKKPIDLITVPQHMKQQATLSKLKMHGGEAHLAELVNKVTQIDNIHHHAHMVAEHAVARYTLHVASDLQQRAYDPEIAKILARTQDRLAKLLDTTRSRPALKPFDKEHFLKDCRAALSRPIAPKLPFGFAPLDEHMDGGFPAGGVVVLAAPPKHHKTAYLVHCMVHWLRQGQRIVYITGENTAKEIYARLSAHEQFGHTNKFHGRIKHEPEAAEANAKPIDWMAGLLWIVSLPDGETEEPRGPSWLDALDVCDAEKDPPMVIADYVEELAGRLPGRRGITEQEANKEVMCMLKGYASRHQARVLAVCSVGRTSYQGEEGVYNKPDARPEDFKAVVKHTGYIDFAAFALLALQLPQDVSNAEIEHPENGHPCLPMRLHLAFTREGKGPVTLPLFSFAGYCRFMLDERGDPDGPPSPRDLKGLILWELAKDQHQDGQRGEVIAELIKRREKAVKDALKELVKEGQVHQFVRKRAILYQHPKYALPLALGDDNGGLPN